jgi:hypothetical protein
MMSTTLACRSILMPALLSIVFPRRTTIEFICCYPGFSRTHPIVSGTQPIVNPSSTHRQPIVNPSSTHCQPIVNPSSTHRSMERKLRLSCPPSPSCLPCPPLTCLRHKRHEEYNDKPDNCLGGACARVLVVEIKH